MKNKINFTLLRSVMMVTAIACVITTNRAKAQCPTYSANVSENTTSPGNITNTCLFYDNALDMSTGNDIKTTVNSISPARMAVNCWSGTNAGLGWNDFNGNHAATFPMLSVFDPDVALIEALDHTGNSLTWWALLVYIDIPNRNVMLKCYEWNGSTFNVPIGYTITLSTYSGDVPTVNIDADINGNFVVVWNETAGGFIGINEWGGTAGTYGPTLCNSRALLNGTQGYYKPDVCIHQTSGTTDSVHYVFLDSYQTIHVVSNDFTNDVCASTGNSWNDLTVTLTGNDYYKNPRIACPPDAVNSSSSDWSASVMIADFTWSGVNTIKSVFGFTSYSSTIYRWDYTDATSGLCNEHSGIYNFSEAPVSYDHAGNGIMVGWFFDQLDTLLEHTSVAVVCDLTGQPDASCYNSGNLGYMTVPQLYSPPYRHEWYLSIAGRDDNCDADMLYTFWEYEPDHSSACNMGLPNPVLADIYYKTVQFCNNNYSLRHHTQLAGKNNDVISVSPNPFHESILIEFPSEFKGAARIKVNTVEGQLEGEIKGNETELNQSLKQITDNLVEGIYILTVNYGNETVSKKLVKY